jgi:hypothetical protein
MGNRAVWKPRFASITIDTQPVEPPTLSNCATVLGVSRTFLVRALQTHLTLHHNTGTLRLNRNGAPLTVEFVGISDSQR